MGRGERKALYQLFEHEHSFPEIPEIWELLCYSCAALMSQCIGSLLHFAYVQSQLLTLQLFQRLGTLDTTIKPDQVMSVLAIWTGDVFAPVAHQRTCSNFTTLIDLR